MSGAHPVEPTTTDLAIERTKLADERTHLADERTKLALTRTTLALDRTLMAWVRTATSLISFGFTIYKVLQAVKVSEPSSETFLLGPRGVALVMMVLGVGGLIAATVQHRRQVHELHREYAMYGPFSGSVTPAVATIIAGLGAIGCVLVFFRQLLIPLVWET